MILICVESFDGNFLENGLYEIKHCSGDIGGLYNLKSGNSTGLIYLPTLEYWWTTTPRAKGDLAARFAPACNAMNILYGVK